MRLTIDQIIEYQTQGYLVAEDVFLDSDLDPVITELRDYIDKRACELKEQGKLSDLFENEPFERRYAMLFQQCPEIGAQMDIMHLRMESLYQFLKNDRLLDIVECLLGSELTCNPIQHLRAKLPSTLLGNQSDTFQNVPWHQDAGVTLEEADFSNIITFWIPLVDVTEKSGCMEVMPGAFKLGQLKHQAEGGTTIVHEQLPQMTPQPVPCRKGGMVIMNKYTPHRGTLNQSNHVRWTLDLRYHKTGESSGRPFHPAFTVRSKDNSTDVAPSYEEWCKLWIEALENAKSTRMHRV